MPTPEYILKITNKLEWNAGKNTIWIAGIAGVAIIIKTVTDNNKRTVSDVRHTLTKSGGSLGESGSVMWNFEQKGVIRLDAKKSR